MTKYLTKHSSRFVISIRRDFRYLGFALQVWCYPHPDDGQLNWGIELNLLGITVMFQDNNW